MQKCRACLCRTCVNSCRCHNCEGKVRECEKYNGFWQASIFGSPPEPKYQKAPRYSWEHYGISKERHKQLMEYIRSGKYASVASQAAHTANETIAEYILLSVMKNRSYEDIEYAERLGRIPCGRTDFYGYRRYFISLFDKEMRKIGK